ncbi:MAG: response regulator [Bacteroidales bacterium]
MSPPGADGAFRILVVDDEPLSRHMVARMFTSLGANQVAFAASAAEAREMMENDPRVSLIVSDHYMPGQSGIHLLGDLRQGRLPLPHDTPFMIATLSTSFALSAVALALDVDSFISKPFAKEQLARRLYHTLVAEGRTIKPFEHYRALDIAAMLRAAEALDPLAARAAPPTVPLARVAPDTPLAADLISEDGHCLLQKGTVLTRHLIERLRELGITRVPVVR